MNVTSEIESAVNTAMEKFEIIDDILNNVGIEYSAAIEDSEEG
ncbi:MAG: hypothetical protein ABIP30_17520 [Ferruginibacter sp.]